MHFKMKADSMSKFNNEIDFRKCSIDIIDILFPKQKYRRSLSPRRYISYFRSLCKKDQLTIITDSNDSNEFSEDTKFKCGGTSLMMCVPMM